MKVKLISYTKAADDIPAKNAEELISYIARVSNPNNQKLNENTGRLVNYLEKHNHWSPFEHYYVSVEITTTRDIARQILRHRSFVFQEYSGRYADMNDTGSDYLMREARMQDDKNRQNSFETEDEQLKLQWAAKQQQVVHEAQLAYKWALEKGIAKEVARVVLPEGNTPSIIIMGGNIRSWMHYIQLRTGPETQKEHREVAREVANVISRVYPHIENFVNKE